MDRMTLYQWAKFLKIPMEEKLIREPGGLVPESFQARIDWLPGEIVIMKDPAPKTIQQPDGHFTFGCVTKPIEKEKGMNIIEALKSGRNIRRKSWSGGLGAIIQKGEPAIHLKFSTPDILAEDWEVEPLTILSLTGHGSLPQIKIEFSDDEILNISVDQFSALKEYIIGSHVPGRP